MKSIKLLLAEMLIIIAISVSGVWIVIEFLIYLVKDDPFNWWSIFTFVILFIIIIGQQVVSSVSKMKEKEKIGRHKKVVSKKNLIKR